MSCGDIIEHMACDLPDGWTMKRYTRTIGANGNIRSDVHYLAPNRSLIQSMVGLKIYLGGSFNLTGFNFHTGRFEASQVSRKVKTKLKQPRSTEQNPPNHSQPAATSAVNFATPSSSKRGRPRKTSVVPNTTSTPSLSTIPKKMRVSDKLYPIYSGIQKGKAPFILAGKRPQLPSSSTAIEEVGMSVASPSPSSPPPAAESSGERITPPEDIRILYESRRFKLPVSRTSTRADNVMKPRVRTAPLSDFRGPCSLPPGWLMERRVGKDGPLAGKVEDVSYLSPDNSIRIRSFVELKKHFGDHFRINLSYFNYDSGKYKWEEDDESSRENDHLPNIQAESGENRADRKCNTGVKLEKAPPSSYKRGRGRPRKTSVVHTAGSSKSKFVVESTPSSKRVDKLSLMENSKVEKNPISIKCGNCALPGDWMMVERTRMRGDLPPQTCVSYTLNEGETQLTFRSKQALQRHFQWFDLTEFNFETGKWTDILAVANTAESVESTTYVDESTSSSLASTRGERLAICDVVEKTTIDYPNAREDPSLQFLKATVKGDKSGKPCNVERSRQLPSTSYLEVEDNSPLEQIGAELNRETQMEVPAERLGSSRKRYKKIGWSACPRGLPPGWLWRKIKRTSGRFEGKVDVYYLSPEYKYIRSMTSLKKHFDEIGFDLCTFDYNTATFKKRRQRTAKRPTALVSESGNEVGANVDALVRSRVGGKRSQQF